MPTYFKLSILFLSVFIVQIGFAQQKEIGTWNNLVVKKKITEKWSAYTELQFRSIGFYERFFYYEAKVGISYSPQKNYSFTVGGGSYSTFHEGLEYEGVTKSKQIRTWEQFTFSHKISLLDFEHRFRLEQRYNAEFESRLVYKINIKTPLQFVASDPNLLFVYVYDEFYTDKHLTGADQNRLSIGIGIRINSQLNFQSGWLLQSDFSKSPTWIKNYFLTSVAYTF